MEKIVGIIGGMGPEATIDFMTRILENTPVQVDQDHIRMLVDHNPKVPSRINALVEGNGKSPAPVLRKMARNLENMGADLLAIPCNTAHHYLSDIRKGITIPILDMIQLTLQAIIEDHVQCRQVGLLASTAVINTDLYKSVFEKNGVSVIYPEKHWQEKVMEIIKAVKRKDYSNEYETVLDAILNDLVRKGAEILIIGCTELSAVIKTTDLRLPMYDASDILAREVVRVCKHN